jgi:hypothetical protein
MADTKFGRRFFDKVYKGDASGDLIEAGDTLEVIKANSDGTRSVQNITVLEVSADGFEVYWEYDAANLYLRPEDVVGVGEAHNWECPEAGNIGITAVDDLTETITSFEINGVETTGSWPITAEGAVDLQAALNTALAGNGAATVVYVDTGTDYFRVYVMNTTATIEVGGVALTTLP